MKNFSYIVLLLFLVTISCEKPTQHRVVTPEEMEELLEFENIQLIDVRSVEDYLLKHLKGAQRIELDDDFDTNISYLDKSKPVAIYCNTGRSTKEFAEKLKEKGFVKIYELKDGIEGWESSMYFIYEDTSM